MNANENLGRYLRYFLVDYLAGQRNASPHTVHAYRDALKFLLVHVAHARGIDVSDLSIENLDQRLVLSYLETLERDRGNSATTRNLRLTAVRSFFRAVARVAPEHLQQAQAILSIPQKRTNTRDVEYLSVCETQTILKQPSTSTWMGRRDDALLRFLYNTGARVQEALDVSLSSLRLQEPFHVMLVGKGRKERLCPLWPQTVAAVQRVLSDRGGNASAATQVFANRQGEPLSRYGVRYILTKYVNLASSECPSLRGKRVHPHTMRHTTAMHLLQSGVDLNTIRCWLGHVDVTTTNRYVEADLEMKRKALGELRVPAGRRTIRVGKSLLAWLEAL